MALCHFVVHTTCIFLGARFQHSVINWHYQIKTFFSSYFSIQCMIAMCHFWDPNNILQKFYGNHLCHSNHNHDIYIFVYFGPSFFEFFVNDMFYLQFKFFRLFWYASIYFFLSWPFFFEFFVTDIFYLHLKVFHLFWYLETHDF